MSKWLPGRFGIEHTAFTIEIPLSKIGRCASGGYLTTHCHVNKFNLGPDKFYKGRSQEKPHSCRPGVFLLRSARE